MKCLFGVCCLVCSEERKVNYVISVGYQVSARQLVSVVTCQAGRQRLDWPHSLTVSAPRQASQQAAATTG